MTFAGILTLVGDFDICGLYTSPPPPPVVPKGELPERPNLYAHFRDNVSPKGALNATRHHPPIQQATRIPVS